MSVSKRDTVSETILHLTDIHFGWEGSSPSGLADRKVCLEGMLEEVGRLEPKWRPTIICITGDIAWRGAHSDYTNARAWLDRLLVACGLKYSHVLFCPGNHDVDRLPAKRIPRPEKSAEADASLEFPIADHWLKPFAEYIKFTESCGVPTWRLGATDSPVAGERTVNGIRFVALNSAWCSKGDDDQHRLWMGRPHIVVLEANNQLREVGPSQREPLTVALMHHPLDWLHPDEQHAAAGRPPTWDYLAHRCHVLLTGHTHGQVRGADRIVDRALHFTGGSAYQGAAHTNSFRLIRVEPDWVEDRSFEFDPRAASSPWKPLPANSRPMYHELGAAPAPASHAPTPDTAAIRLRCRSHALKQVDLKSRLLRQHGVLPNPIDRPVALRVSAQQPEFDERGKLVRKNESETRLPFYEAVRAARRSILLGDLGHGKSTLASRLVVETIDKSEQGFAAFVPVKKLVLTGQFTTIDLLRAVEVYVRNEVCVGLSPLDLAEMLNQQTEVLIVLDGLDELARELAARVLQRAAALVDSWATIQVVATARPVELLGVSFADWCTLNTVALDDDAKAAFIREELVADGVPAATIAVECATLSAALKGVAALDAIANSPLAIRLLYPRLKTLGNDVALSLGDLLYELLTERLSGWQRRDDKPSGSAELDKRFPAADQKAALLGVLAARAASGQMVSAEAADTLLQGAMTNISAGDRPALAGEALALFEWLGLISKGESIEFPLQPLAEVCSAVAVLAQRDGKALDFTQTGWRSVSFAAAIARRRGLFEAIRRPLSDYVDDLIAKKQNVQAACYIVVEASDVALAELAIAGFDRVAYRPLTIDFDERSSSARVVAKALLLAGNRGFDWFYSEYLDPRFPVPNAGCAIVMEVFSEWAALIRPRLTADQNEKLAKMVMPYSATEEASFHGVLLPLAALVPDRFPLPERIWHQSALIGSRLFGAWAETEFRRLRQDEETRKTVDQFVLARASARPRAAQLWLEWHPEIPPPTEIVVCAIRSCSKHDGNEESPELVSECIRRLGEDRWLTFVRWSLVSGDVSVSAGAAKILFERGERRVEVLGDAVLESTHDGGHVRESEKILTTLVQDMGLAGVRWLAHKIIYADKWNGASSGWWRVLLPKINDVPEGPNLLAAATRNLGPYTLPRYPEVREAFGRLLLGNRGVAFRNALRTRLTSLEPDARRGAAAVLVSSDPRGEADALYVMMRARAQWSLSDWHEWESFCLTLDFGPSVLESLKNHLGSLEARSRGLALVLLRKAEIDLGPQGDAELEKLLSEHINWRLSYELVVRSGFATQASFQVQLRQLAGPNIQVAERAGERLLEYHRTRLSPETEAKCEVIIHQGLSRYWTLPGVMLRIAQEPDFRMRVVTACKDLEPLLGPKPTLGAIARAISGEIVWKDVLWSLLCDDSTHSRGASGCEDTGMALLQFGLEMPAHRPAIGKAALECVVDPRLLQNRWHEVYHWLALLADEFGPLDPALMRKAVLHGKPIHYPATTALIARLGEVPEGFVRDRSSSPKPPALVEVPTAAPDATKIVATLVDCCRNSERPHPRLLAAFQDCLALPELEGADLKKIAEAGNPGVMAAAALKFVYGWKVSLADTIPILDIRAWSWVDDSRRTQWGPLFRLYEVIRALSLSQGSPEAAAYLKALDDALQAGNIWTLPVAWDLLEIQGSLSAHQVDPVFRTYAEHNTYLHEVLFRLLAAWLGEELPAATKSNALTAAEHAVQILNEDGWRKSRNERDNVWAYLLFPAIQWALGGKSSEAADAVFLRGIRAIFERLPPSGQASVNLPRMVGQLDPLLAKTPPEILAHVVQRGIDSLEPSVAAVCRLLDALSRARG